jgi:alpha-ketoglutaric semialdehyde dehydrogenase
MIYSDATQLEIATCLENASAAFMQFRETSPAQRHQLLRAIAAQLQLARDQLVATAMRETNLPAVRLHNELNRTQFQLESYGAACEKGYWMEASIDVDAAAQPPKPDLRKHLVPLGPVVVFGSSNFPFAYSTAGGDTASALAAGCTVIIKAHPAHLETSILAAACVNRAMEQCQLSPFVFQHVIGNSHQVGEWLVKHPATRAVAFTGSQAGGKQLFDWGAQRSVPIPVFAEMGSVNPVFLLPEKLQQDAAAMAAQLAASFSLGVGQFCTKPGLIIGLESESLQAFVQALQHATWSLQPMPMLHAGIEKAYQLKSKKIVAQPQVELVAESSLPPKEGEGQPLVVKVNASHWLENPLLQEENFGPFTLLVVCKDATEMTAIAQALEGQLTCTVMATQSELSQHKKLMSLLTERCGRLIYNGVPTGVEVCKSMQHGGPYPATTDVRFGAVGEDAIRRFIRPISYQNWPDAQLPLSLQESNPWKIPRFRNGQLE